MRTRLPILRATGRRSPVAEQRPASDAAYDHRSERIRKAFGFSRFQWYVVAPIEARVRYLIWRLTEGRNV